MKNESNEPRLDVDDTVDAAVDGGGLVEKLLSAAGPGPEIPDDGAEKGGGDNDHRYPSLRFSVYSEAISRSLARTAHSGPKP